MKRKNKWMMVTAVMAIIILCNIYDRHKPFVSATYPSTSENETASDIIFLGPSSIVMFKFP